jgi:S1-C subfamily serine protease
VIADVDPLGPAYTAGLKPGDVLIEANGIKTHARFAEDLPNVLRLIADYPVGKELTIAVQRDNEVRRFALVTVEKGATREDETEFSAWGFTGAEPTPEAVRFAQLSGKKGIVVTGVQVGGIAGNAGLSQGDIILKIDGVEVADREVFMSVYQQAVDQPKNRVLLVVKHGALSRYVLIKNDPKPSVDTPVDKAAGEPEQTNGRN